MENTNDRNKALEAKSVSVVKLDILNIPEEMRSKINLKELLKQAQEFWRQSMRYWWERGLDDNEKFLKK